MTRTASLSTRTTKTQNPEIQATESLHALIYGGAGPKFLGWKHADLLLLPDGTWKKVGEEGWRFWAVPTEFDERRRWNPVWDHIKGNNRGVVALDAKTVPFITVDLDRHRASVPAREHTLRVLKAGRLLRRHVTELAWSVAEVNPKNGSAKIFGVTGKPIPLDIAVELAQRVHALLLDHGLGNLEVFPFSCQQVGLPVRADKITIGPSGVLERCVRKRKSNGKMESFEAYSTVSLLGAIRSRSAYDEDALFRTLKAACANLPDRPKVEPASLSQPDRIDPQPRTEVPSEMKMAGDDQAEPNALTRQLHALLEVSRRVGRVPSEAEALTFIKENMLFSGDWGNAARRSQRVRWVLGHIAKTFDPEKCRGPRHTIRFGKYDNWARAHVGVLREKVRATVDEYGEVRERRGRTTADWRFVSAMLSVLEYCFDRPNPDNSLPQTGARRIWETWHHAGLVDVRWDDHKWAIVRDWLDKIGVIEVFDRDWHYGHGKGRAMKWRPTQRFRDLHVWYKAKKRPAGNDPVPLAVFLAGMRTTHPLNYCLDTEVGAGAFGPMEWRCRPPPGRLIPLQTTPSQKTTASRSEGLAALRTNSSSLKLNVTRDCSARGSSWRCFTGWGRTDQVRRP
jgi:hypothetical protein